MEVDCYCKLRSIGLQQKKKKKRLNSSASFLKSVINSLLQIPEECMEFLANKDTFQNGPKSLRTF